MTVAQDEILGTANRLHPRSPVGTTDTSTVRGPSARASNVGPDDTPGVPSPEQSRGVSPRNDANPLQFALCEQSRGVPPRNDANGRNSPLCEQSRGVPPRNTANNLSPAQSSAAKLAAFKQPWRSQISERPRRRPDLTNAAALINSRHHFRAERNPKMSRTLSSVSLQRPTVCHATQASAIWPALVAGAVFILMSGAFVAAYAWDLSALLCTAEERCGQPPFEYVRVGFGKGGYDGQFCYQIARNPWVTHSDVHPVRHLRVLYPAFAWAASGGDPVVLFWTLPFINFLAIGGMAYLGAVMARNYGLSPWWGALLPVVVNAYMLALRNLTDPLSILCALTLMVGWQRRWPVWAMALCGLAALFCRETNLLVLGVILLIAAAARRWSLVAAMVGCVAVWGLWVVVVFQLYGQWPFLPRGGNLGLPLVGVIEHFQSRVPTIESLALRFSHFLAIGFLLVQALLGVYLLLKEGEPAVKLLLAGGLLLSLCGGAAVYASPWSMLRVFALIPLAVWLLSIQSRRIGPLIVLSLTLVWPILIVAQAWLS